MSGVATTDPERDCTEPMPSPDVGVLVIHGIGTQSKGSTLREFIDPVLRYLSAYGASKGSTGTRLLPRPAGEEGDFVRIATAIDAAAPAPGQPTTQTWLVAEAWWADCFDAPDRGEVSRWLADVGPWFAYFFAARIWRRFYVRWWDVLIGLTVAVPAALTLYGVLHGDAHTQALAVALVGIIVVALGAPRVAPPAIVVATVLLILPLAALASGVMVLLWLVGLLPGAWSAKVRAVQLGMARSLGDAYALISSERRERAMSDVITDALRKLTAKLADPEKPVVLIAHSLGAALTYRLFNRDPAFREALGNRRVTWVTHGSAVLPVHVLERRLRAKGRGWQRVRGLAGFVGLLLLVSTFGRVVADALSDPIRIVALVGAALAGISFMAAVYDVNHAACDDGDRTSAWRRRAKVEATKPSEAVSVRKGENLGPVAHEEKQAHAVLGPQETSLALSGLNVEAKSNDLQVCPSIPTDCFESLRWVDIWAPWDPVPNGPLEPDHGSVDPSDPAKALPKLSEAGQFSFLPCRVANNHQPWRDHVVYRMNHEDVVSRWVGEVAIRGNEALNPADLQLHAPTFRTERIKRGQLLLALQGAFLAGTVAVLAWRSGALDDLGRRALRWTPARSALDTVGGVIPSGVRSYLFGADHDPARLHGTVVAAVGSVLLLALCTAAASSVTSGAGRRFLSNETAPKRNRRGRIAVVFAIALAAVFGAGELVDDKGRSVSYAIRVEPILGERRVPTAVVVFQPLGYEKSAALEVKYPKPKRVQLDPELRYTTTASVDGGNKCKVLVDRVNRRVTIYDCAATGAVVP